MKIVYIVENCYPDFHGGSSSVIVGVFDDSDKADEFARCQEASITSILEWEVNGNQIN